MKSSRKTVKGTSTLPAIIAYKFVFAPLSPAKLDLAFGDEMHSIRVYVVYIVGRQYKCVHRNIVLFYAKDTIDLANLHCRAT